MNQQISAHLPEPWSEAQRRAETYLRVLYGKFGPSERQLVTRATLAAGEEQRRKAVHPVTLVMESLFALLPSEKTVVAMTPPIQRASMLPERTEFPLHDWLRRLFRRRIFAFALAR